MENKIYKPDRQNALLEKELQALRSEYEKQQMTGEQIKQLQQTIREVGKMEQNKINQTRNQTSAWKYVAAVAAVVAAVFVILPNTSGTIAHAMEQIPIIGSLVKVVTFRDYEYESDRNMADIQVPEIKQEEQVENSTLQENLDRTTAEINAEIQEITDNLITEFETNLKNEWGYQDVVVTSEVLATTPDYFTLKLICYQGAGSGYEWNYFYTIDLNTGERLQLKDIFKEGADYITPISDNIKQQMQERMDADENVYYWLNDEIEEWNFQAITDETSFYLNEKGNVVIGFNEGDVAPMYMGCVEFVIPSDVMEGIRK